ncbi:MAG: DUF4124 domain-containing protein [Oleibacter sp.]|nr:DUF4124 domain-containing protein [Thalassolituus sp.]
MDYSSSKTLVLITMAFSCLCTSVSATEVYVSRDASGNAVFSDRPSANSESLTIRDLSTVPAIGTQEADKDEQSEPEPNSAIEYTSLSIISPLSGTVIPNGAAGDVEISAVLTPALGPKHKIVLMDNGQVVKEGRQTTFKLNNLDRGEHSLSMMVQNDAGDTQITSQQVTIYINRPSALR